MMCGKAEEYKKRIAPPSPQMGVSNRKQMLILTPAWQDLEPPRRQASGHICEELSSLD